MYGFGRVSQERLQQCDPRLQVILNVAIKYMDFSIICAERDEAAQMEAFDKGLSNAVYGESPHNYNKSYAVDIVPYPVDWMDMERFCYLGGLMKGIAVMHNIPLTWGYDWNGNGVLVNADPAERLTDAPHFELTKWRQLEDDRLSN